MSNANHILTKLLLFFPNYHQNLTVKIFNNKVGIQNYKGDIRLHIESAEKFTFIDEFLQKLNTISNLEIVFSGWSKKKGLVIFIYLKSSVPLVNTLRQMKIVEQVYKKSKKDIVVILNSSYTEMVSSIQKTLKEGILVV